MAQIVHAIRTDPSRCPTCGHFLTGHRGFTLDLDSNSVVLDGRVIHLEPKLAELMSVLIEQMPRPVPMDRILQRLYGYGEDCDAATIRTFVHKLRDGLSGTRLKVVTHYGDGYSALLESDA